MPTQANFDRLTKAGIKDVKNIPDAAVDELSKLSDDELGALAVAQSKLAPLGTFGGVIF